MAISNFDEEETKVVSRKREGLSILNMFLIKTKAMTYGRKDILVEWNVKIQHPFGFLVLLFYYVIFGEDRRNTRYIRG